MKEWRKEFYAQHFIHQSGLFVISFLVFRVRLVHTLCFFEAHPHIFCNVAVRRCLPGISLHLYRLFSQLLWPQPLTADAEPPCLFLTSPFLEETWFLWPQRGTNVPLITSLHLFVPLRYMMICSSSWWSLPSSLPDVTALFPEFTSGQNSHFPPKSCWVVLNTFPSLLSKAELAGETVSGLLIHFAFDNLKV